MGSRNTFKKRKITNILADIFIFRKRAKGFKKLY